MRSGGWGGEMGSSADELLDFRCTLLRDMPILRTFRKTPHQCSRHSRHSGEISESSDDSRDLFQRSPRYPTSWSRQQVGTSLFKPGTYIVRGVSP